MRRLAGARAVVGAYVVVLLCILGLLSVRSPWQTVREPAVTVFTPAGVRAPAAPASHQTPESRTPWWVQVIRPGPGLARQILHAGVPLLRFSGHAGNGAGAADSRGLRLYGEAAAPAPDLFSHLLPFLQPPQAAVSRPAAAQGPSAGALLPPTQQDMQPWSPARPPASVPTFELPSAAPQDAAAARSLPADPLVGIYHTHDYESYVSEFPDRTFAPDELMLVISDDPERSVIRVGRALAEALQRRGITAVHSPAAHQEWGYAGAYSLSLRTARQILARYPTVAVLIDLHRDSAPRAQSVTTLNEAKVARIAIVIARGSDDLPQPGWTANLALARELVAAMDEMYPGLSRGIIQAPARYNQHLSPGAILVEVGSAENTMDEALQAAELFADVLARVIAERRYPQAGSP